MPCNSAKLVLLQLKPASLVVLALGSARREGFRADLGNFQPLRAAWKAGGCQRRNTKISRLHWDRQCWWSKDCQAWWRSKPFPLCRCPVPCCDTGTLSSDSDCGILSPGAEPTCAQGAKMCLLLAQPWSLWQAACSTWGWERS